MERVQKRSGEKLWTLTLRKVATEPDRHGRLRVDWWTEQFDAVVVATVAENDAPWVPAIPGLKEWAEALPNEIYHGRNYRRPENLEGKVSTILDLSMYQLPDRFPERPHRRRLAVRCRYCSRFDSSCCFCDRKRQSKQIAFHSREQKSELGFGYQNHSMDNPIVVAVTNLIPQNASIVPEIESFSKYPRSGYNSAREASIRLSNGTVLEHFDHVSVFLELLMACLLTPPQ